MTVKCETVPPVHRKKLSVGNEYEVIHVVKVPLHKKGSSYYCLIGDDGKQGKFPCNLFSITQCDEAT